ncbi:MAG: hypothetical protein QHI38_09850, partial [Armatimonadota bacterium]|nr:hypothetical protein [Armatimonadota bacterium]
MTRKECHPERPKRHPELDSGSPPSKNKPSWMPDQARHDIIAHRHDEKRMSFLNATTVILNALNVIPERHRCHPELDSGSPPSKSKPSWMP